MVLDFKISDLRIVTSRKMISINCDETLIKVLSEIDSARICLFVGSIATQSQEILPNFKQCLINDKFRYPFAFREISFEDDNYETSSSHIETWFHA